MSSVVRHRNVEAQLESTVFDDEKNAPPRVQTWSEKVSNAPRASCFSSWVPLVAGFLPYASLLAFAAKPPSAWDPKTAMQIIFGLIVVLWALFSVYLDLGIKYKDNSPFSLSSAEVTKWQQSISWILGPALALTIPMASMQVINIVLVSKSPPGEYFNDCMGGLGYGASLSFIVGNIFFEGYVFLFVTFVIFNVIIHRQLPGCSLDDVRSLVGCGSWCKCGSNGREYPRPTFVLQMLMLKVGIALFLVTGIIPAVAPGTSKLPVDIPLQLTKGYHTPGVIGGMVLILVSVLWYTTQAIRIKAAHHPERLIPHVLVLWGSLVLLVGALGFIVASQVEGGQSETPFHSICILRDPTAGANLCGTPRGLNWTAHRAIFEPASPNYNWTEPHCVPTADGASCYDPHCKFDANTPVYAFESSLLVASGFVAQMFVSLLNIDADLIADFTYSYSYTHG